MKHIPSHTVIHILLTIFARIFESKYYLLYAMHYKLFKSFGIFVDDWYNDLCFVLITVKEKIVTCQLFDFYSNSFVATVLIFQYTYLKK